jgi:hypothetical protein
LEKTLKCPPVLFLIFNRPDLTQLVFESIRNAAPKQLFIAADGPRPDISQDKEQCERTRQIVDVIDWDCETHTLFRETNLGCKRAVYSAINWFFNHVESGVILEDDCLVHHTFFRFCAELLKRYYNDERIMAISGDNFQQGMQRTQYSYYFSRYNHIWGWATWRRAWQHYDVEMKHWPVLRESLWLMDIISDETAATYWRKAFDKAHADKIDTWDFAWTYTCWMQNGLTVLPEVNLVSNIGFGNEATHTKSRKSRVANLSTTTIEFPLRHPPYVIRLHEADLFTFAALFHKNLKHGLWERTVKKLKKYILKLRTWILIRIAKIK